MRKKPFDFSRGKDFGIQDIDIADGFGYWGMDAKGLIYLTTSLPRYQRDTATKDKTLCFFILDPWKTKAVFKELNTGQTYPPEGVSTGLPLAIAPDGNIYFFDVDLLNRQFVLSRLVNTWWDELDLKNVTTATANDNRIRLRDSPSLNGKVLDFLYENEISRVLETGTKKEIIAGSPAAWYKIQLPDDRVGWVFGAFLDLEK